MYETFEHTADLGLRIRAPDLDTLFVEAAQALFATLVDNIDAVEPRQKLEIHLTGDENEYLLFDWLNELLYRFDTEHLLCSRFEVKVIPPSKTNDGEVSATVWGEPLDRGRHLPGHEVKAITYHELKVERTNDGWLAEVIVDI